MEEGRGRSTCLPPRFEGGEREGRERGEEGERGERKGEGGEGEGRSLPYQSKNRSRAPGCV